VKILSVLSWLSSAALAATLAERRAHHTRRTGCRRRSVSSE
jgi:uncharacterized membrane protein required for colicin V production